MTATEFQNIIMPTQGFMVSVAYKMLPPSLSADDAVQDVLRGLWERHGNLRIPDNVRAFAARCIRNRCLDILRQHHSTLNFEEWSRTESTDDQFTTEDDVYSERLDLIWQTIDILEEPRKTVLKMCLDGKSNKDIAKYLRISEPNVRQILSRARKQLKETILNIYRQESEKSNRQKK